MTPGMVVDRLDIIARGPRSGWAKAIKGLEPEDIRDVKLGGFEAGHLSLMKSELRREGAVYTEVGRVELK